MNKLLNLLVMVGLPAQACGGKAIDHQPGSGASDTDPSTGGTQAENSGGTTAEPSATGGSPSTGGATGSGGIGTGGLSAGGAGGGAPDECPSEQWVCEGLQCRGPALETPSLWEAYDGCICDSTRPATADDCGSNEKFVCDKIDPTLAPSGRITCACVSDSEPYWCSENNPTKFTLPDEDFLCGCAWPLIR